MRAFTSSEMIMLYRVARTCFFVGGAGLLTYGAWFLVYPTVYHVNNPLALVGILPIYIGGMLILVAAAMKEDWFTNARRYW